MARSKKNITLDEKIEKAQIKVFQTKDMYETAVEELNQLQKKKQELQKQELIKAIEMSRKSYDEIMKFLNEESETDED